MDQATIDALFAPLCRFSDLHPEIQPDEFMHMGMTGAINLYKHCRTRRYLHLDAQGDVWVYLPTIGFFHRDELPVSARIAYVLER